MVKMMWVVLPLLALVMLAAAGAAAKGKGGRKASGDLSGKRPLTKREQAMYFRLIQAFPEHVVLAQVAFSALLVTKDRPTRSTFDRKVCDFVVCTKAFDVLAVIELDDASHQGRADADAKREDLLKRAGYRVERFAQVPDVLDVQRRFAPATDQTTVPAARAVAETA